MNKILIRDIDFTGKQLTAFEEIALREGRDVNEVIVDCAVASLDINLDVDEFAFGLEDILIN